MVEYEHDISGVLQAFFKTVSKLVDHSARDHTLVAAHGSLPTIL